MNNEPGAGCLPLDARHENNGHNSLSEVQSYASNAEAEFPDAFHFKVRVWFQPDTGHALCAHCQFEGPFQKADKPNNNPTNNTVQLQSSANYVHNAILVTGPKIDREALLSLVNGESAFDFNKVIPMPPSLNAIAGSESESAMAVAEFAKLGHSKGLTEMLSYPWVKKEGIKTEREMFDYLLKKSLGPLAFGNLLLDNKKKYGAPTWYEWVPENWGTKWNAYEVQEPAHADKFTLFEFDTDWDAPRPVLEALSKRFPRLQFAVRCYPELDEKYGYELKAGHEISLGCAYARKNQDVDRESIETEGAL